MTTLILKTVSRTLEARCEDGYTYRFIENSEYTIVRRVKTPEPFRTALWNHGVLCEQQEAGTGKWKPSCTVVRPKLYGTLDEAIGIFGADDTVVEV